MPDMEPVCAEHRIPWPCRPCSAKLGTTILVEVPEVTSPQPERFLLRFCGGQFAGTHIVREGEVYLYASTTEPETYWSWPLPDHLVAPGGIYRKVAESQLPPQPADSHVVRGAEYEWVRTTLGGSDA